MRRAVQGNRTQHSGGAFRAIALAAGTLVAALTLLFPGPAQAGQVVIAGSGNCTDMYRYFTIPTEVNWLEVDAYGGYGGGNEHTGQGGPGGRVTAFIPVTPGQQLAISPGSYGSSSGGCGWAKGGDRGGADGGDLLGRDGYGGASASAVLDYDPDNGSVSPLVVAGGGGGGGGNGHHAGGYGGTGGFQPDGGASGGHNGHGDGSGDGGQGGGEGGIHGGEGDSVYAGEGGAGGGGGGGYPYAGRGGGSASQGGGGGGGGGRSWAINGSQDVNYSVAPNNCPYPDSSPACHGQVTLTWDTTATKITSTGGNGQAAQLGQPFGERLTANVVNAEGFPVQGVNVTFSLPAGGPSGTFGSGDTSAQVTTNTQGNAVSPVLIAGSSAGPWTARASIAETHTNYSLANDKATTDVILEASHDPSFAGQPVTFTATLQTATRLPTPWSGDLQFYIDGVALGGTLEVPASGTVSSPEIEFGTGPYPVGDYTVTAAYAGDNNHDPATSPPYTQEVTKASTGTALRSSPNPSTSGQSPVLTATVTSEQGSAAVPDGLIQFKVAPSPGANPLDWGSPVDLNPDGQASSDPFPFPLDGSYELSADYLGSGSFEASSGAAVQSVGVDATVTEVSSSVNPSVAGQPYVITATVIRSGPGDEPSGVVDFTIGTRVLCSAVSLDPQGQATCAGPAGLPAQPNVVRADFSDPSAQYAPSYGLLSQRVTPANSRTTMALSQDRHSFGEPVTATATVQAVAPGQVVPDGTVQFYVDDLPVGLPVAVVQGKAVSGPLAGLSVGSHRIAADYEDDSDPLRLRPSRGITKLVVDPAGTTIRVASIANPSQEGKPISFTARVDTIEPLTGDVQFLVDGAAFGGPVPVHDGIAVSQTTEELSVGDHQVVAEVNGGTSFLPGQASLTQKITSFNPPGPPDPPPGSSRASLRTRAVRADNRGVVNLVISCRGPEGSSCAGTLTLRTPDGTRLGNKYFQMATGRAKPVRLRLRGTAGRRLASGSFRARATITGPEQPEPSVSWVRLSGSRAAKALIRNRYAWLTKRGRLALTVKCRDRSEHCRGQLTLNAEDGSRLGRVNFTIPGGETQYVPVRLRAGTRKALKRKHRIRMRASVATRVEVGRPNASSRAFDARARR